MRFVSEQRSCMVMAKKIKIEVVYASPQTQKLLALDIDEGTTIEMAIHQSGILSFFPEINLQKQKVGVFGKARSLTDVVQEGDRIEIYRPLLIDPKEARRTKAKHHPIKKLKN